jgi:hypothetical protein
MAHELRATRYLTASNEPLARWIATELRYLDFDGTMAFYWEVMRKADDDWQRLLGANDRYYLLTGLCGRTDALHPWVFNRCREVEAATDGYLDLWARYHYKSSITTFAGNLQEIICDPEITICILSCTNKVAKPFLVQIQEELERNETLKRLYSDVFWLEPRKEASRWSRESGIVVKRRGNPKEATVEAHGLVDGMPTGKHYDLLDFDDLVTEELVTNPEIIQKVTDRWELADSLGKATGTRKWHQGTRYSFADTYGIILERGTLKPRIHPATEDGTLKGRPVLLTEERWEQVKDAQRRAVNAQMLLNPIAGNEAMFRSDWFRPYLIRPTVLNVYIMVDPSKGRSATSDRTAMAVVGVDVAGNRYLLDGVRHRMKLSERWEWLKRLYKRWSDEPGVQSITVGYERYGAQTEDEVIREWQERDGVPFELVELSWPREGGHSKKDRVERLEPDMRVGRFYLPGVVYHAENGGRDGVALWSVWTDEDARKNPAAAHKPGQIVYRPLQAPTREQRACEVTGQNYRIVHALKRMDEDRNIYDLTRAFMEEALFFPFAPHDDLIDAASRLYDLSPCAARQYESHEVEPPVFVDT